MESRHGKVQRAMEKNRRASSYCPPKSVSPQWLREKTSDALLPIGESSDLSERQSYRIFMTTIV